jgi:dCTP deaminase
MLPRSAIIQRLCHEHSGLAITPLIDADQQVGKASVDLRLGPDFIVTRRATGLAVFDPARVDDIADHVRDYQDYVRRPPGSSFYLHPGEFALARTLEYITLPWYTAGQVNGRSSWGRLGLVIATAAHVEPTFQGTITLELSNLGTVPIVLYIGVRIAQLVLFDVSEPPDFEAYENENG